MLVLREARNYHHQPSLESHGRRRRPMMRHGQLDPRQPLLQPPSCQQTHNDAPHSRVSPRNRSTKPGRARHGPPKVQVRCTPPTFTRHILLPTMSERIVLEVVLPSHHEWTLSGRLACCIDRRSTMDRDKRQERVDHRGRKMGGDLHSARKRSVTP